VYLFRYASPAYGMVPTLQSRYIQCVGIGILTGFFARATMRRIAAGGVFLFPPPRE
jgi:hypothetical protein